MKLTIDIISRGRPGLLLDTVNQTLPNISRDDTTLFVALDEDDAAGRSCIDKMPADNRVKVSVKPREDSRGEKYDRALVEAPADVYLLGVDCAPLLTPAFDQIIVNAARLFPDGIGCVYTPMANASFPGYQAPTAKLVEKLGCTYNHEYPYWFIDHELDDICRMIGRYVCIDIDVDLKRRRPDNTQRMWDLAFWTAYFDVMTLERRARARAIIKSEDFECPAWQKIVLCNSYQPIESRSHWINSNVRAQAAEIEAQRGEKDPPDEGYKRAKARAEAKLLDLYAAIKEKQAA